ncbi:hypothetical protein HYY75_06585, partial [bacterium]|nr:hypothetical protein [bacterium]
KLLEVSSKPSRERPNPQVRMLKSYISENESKLSQIREKLQFANLSATPTEEPDSEAVNRKQRLQIVENLYHDVIKRLEQIKLNNSVTFGQIEVLEKNSNLPKTLGLSFFQREFVGFLGGTILAIILLYSPFPRQVEVVSVSGTSLLTGGKSFENETNSISTLLQLPDLANGRLALPILDEIPKRFNERLIVLNQPDSPKMVQFKNLRSNLQILLSEIDSRIVVIGSFLHRVFDVDNTRGISTALTGEITPVLIQPTMVKKLGVIPSGPIPSNPVELLGSLAMIDLLNYLKRRVELIFIDTSPLLEFSDAGILISHSSSVIFLQRKDESLEDIRACRDFLKNIKARILGFVQT